MENYPFDVTPVMLKYELTSFQVTPPKEQKRNPFKVRMNVYNLRTTHGSDGRVDSIAKLVSYKSTADKLPEYDIDLSHTCVWFESENKLVERTGKHQVLPNNGRPDSIVPRPRFCALYGPAAQPSVSSHSFT